MTIFFTDEELSWIIKDFGNWHPADGCPDNIKKAIMQKLKVLNDWKEDFEPV